MCTWSDPWSLQLLLGMVLILLFWSWGDFLEVALDMLLLGTFYNRGSYLSISWQGVVARGPSISRVPLPLWAQLLHAGWIKELWRLPWLWRGGHLAGTLDIPPQIFLGILRLAGCCAGDSVEVCPLEFGLLVRGLLSLFDRPQLLVVYFFGTDWTCHSVYCLISAVMNESPHAHTNSQSLW